ncbi:MAG TPA: MBL fold metallo-hydrolase [Acidimicrobiales bacterium]|nr:MBL fold metallo-hydrolase [Acidimicrobiales bacterium]
MTPPGESMETQNESDEALVNEIAPGVLEIDTLLGGWEKATAGYLVTGSRPLLIETGSQSSVATLSRALAQIGVDHESLAGVAVTHIHLDHAGGVGDIARLFPNATVYVHELGARHLVDPSRLIDSASRVYGDLLDSLYGRLDPTDAERIVVLFDDDIVDVGNRAVRAIDSPGHAKHHLAFLDETSGLLFAGDALGVQLPDGGVLRPATPPADFDFTKAIASMRRFSALRPAGIALTHYGLIPLDPNDLLQEAEMRLREWVGVAENAYHGGMDIAEALTAEFAQENDDVDPEQRTRIETLNGIHSNAAGLRRWIETKDRIGG